MADTQETIADIIAWLRRPREGENAYLTLWRDEIADRIEAAHKRKLETKDSVIQTLSAARDDELNRHRREMEALKRRRSELDAEVAAKDEVIKRLNDAISEEQRRKMATTENPSAIGNAAKLREALKHIKDRLPHMLQYMRIHWEDANAGGYFDELMLVIDAALAEPPRNCDVGRAEEQYKRFMNMCNSKDVRQCAECSMRGFTLGCSRDRCFANWAQMPYEEGGAK